MGAGESWQCQNRGEAVIGCVVVDELKASGVWSMNTGFEAAVAVKQPMIYCTLFFLCFFYPIIAIFLALFLFTVVDMIFLLLTIWYVLSQRCQKKKRPHQ